MGVEGAPSSLTSSRADPWNLLCLRSRCSTTVSYSDGISSYTWTWSFSDVAGSQRRVQGGLIECRSAVRASEKGTECSSVQNA